MIHHQRRDVGGHLQVLARVIGPDVESQLVAPGNQTFEQLADAVSFFVGPLADASINCRR